MPYKNEKDGKCHRNVHDLHFQGHEVSPQHSFRANFSNKNRHKPQDYFLSRFLAMKKYENLGPLCFCFARGRATRETIQNICAKISQNKYIY